MNQSAKGRTVGAGFFIHPALPGHGAGRRVASGFFFHSGLCACFSEACRCHGLAPAVPDSTYSRSIWQCHRCAGRSFCRSWPALGIDMLMSRSRSSPLALVEESSKAIFHILISPFVLGPPSSILTVQAGWSQLWVSTPVKLSESIACP